MKGFARCLDFHTAMSASMPLFDHSSNCVSNHFVVIACSVRLLKMTYIGENAPNICFIYSSIPQSILCCCLAACVCFKPCKPACLSAWPNMAHVFCLFEQSCCWICIFCVLFSMPRFPHAPRQPASMPQCSPRHGPCSHCNPPSGYFQPIQSSSYIGIITSSSSFLCNRRNCSNQGGSPLCLHLHGKEEEAAKREGIILACQFSSQPVLLVLIAYQTSFWFHKFLLQQEAPARNVTVFDMEPGELVS